MKIDQILFEIKLKQQKKISKIKTITTTNINICCGGLRQLVGEKAIVYFKIGSSWCGIPNSNFALNYDCWNGNGANCMILKKCPFCHKKLKLKPIDKK